MHNDLILLNQILAQQKINLLPDSVDSKFFEFFSVLQILKDRDLSYEEIESGLVGAGRDGAIDGVYFFANGALIREESELPSNQREIHLELILVQASQGEGFKESSLNSLGVTIDDLFDLSKPLEGFKGTYNEPLLERMHLFRTSCSLLAAKFPSVTIKIFYSTKSVEKPHENVVRLVPKLQQKVEGWFSSSRLDFTFINARTLLDLSRSNPAASQQLTIAENFISTGQRDYVCLVELQEYHRMITKDGKELQKHLFEANVRDYQAKLTLIRILRKR